MNLSDLEGALEASLGAFSMFLSAPVAVAAAPALPPVAVAAAPYTDPVPAIMEAVPVGSDNVAASAGLAPQHG
jgi:hypothetical protein